MKHVCFLSILCIFLSSPAVFSAKVPASASDSISVRYYFNPVVKTGTRTAGAQRDLAASISVITPARIQSVPSHAALDAVNTYVPGLHLTQWNVMGYGAAGVAAGKLSMRGIGGTADTHVMILRNGRPDFMGLMGCTIADEFSVDGVDHIEVVRGPASFLYGSNATAGVINIISGKKEAEGFSTRLNAGYGAYNTQDFGLRHSLRKGRWSYNLTAARRSTDGFRKDAKNTYEGNFFTGNVSYALNSKTSMDVNASLADLYLYDPGFATTPKTDDWYDILRWGGDVTLNHRSRYGESYLKWHGNFGRHRFSDGWRSSDRMTGLIAYHNMRPIRGNTTTIGFDLKRYGGHAEGSVAYTEKTILEYAPYIHIQQLLPARLLLSAGYRLEHHDLFGTVSIPKLGLVAQVTQTRTVRMDFSKGFRSPSIRELYFFPSRNEALKPDEIWNLEAGFGQQIGRILKIDAAVFRITGDNLIAPARRASGSGFQLTNVGKIENKGLEIEITAFPSDRAEIGIVSAFIDMKYPIPNMPKRKTSGFVSWRFSGLTLTGTLVRVEDWTGRDSAAPFPNLYPMKDYTVVDLSVSWRFLKTLEAKLALKNAFDASYQAMYGYPMPGRMLMSEIGYTF
ncbi:MAG TPA: TonB-dependent receptor [bacterium]|nr:TonB-dependent receptor [bacterium]